MPWPGTLAVVHSYLAHKTGDYNTESLISLLPKRMCDILVMTSLPKSVRLHERGEKENLPSSPLHALSSRGL